MTVGITPKQTNCKILIQLGFFAFLLKTEQYRSL